VEEKANTPAPQREYKPGEPVTGDGPDKNQESIDTNIDGQVDIKVSPALNPSLGFLVISSSDICFPITSPPVCGVVYVIRT